MLFYKEFFTKKFLSFSISTCLLLFAYTVSSGQITWILDGDGDWEDAVNWSSNPALPTSTDDVEIDVGGGIVRTISISSISQTVNSLISQENISLVGGDLTLLNGGTVNGDFSSTTNLDLNISGGTFVVNGSVSIDGSNVSLSNGASADLSNLTSYITDTGTNNSRSFEASGDGGVLDLSGLTDLTGGGFIRVLNFEATGGAHINLSSLNNYLGGSTRFEADGDGSLITLSALTTYEDTNSDSSSRLYATNGGTIQTNGLKSINGTGPNNGVHLLVDGASSSIDTSALETFNNGIFELTNGGTTSVASLTNIDGSTVKVSGGSTFTLPSVITAYVTDLGSNQSRTFEADGAGSSLDLSSLTDVTGGGFIRVLNVNVLNGASIDLSNLVNYNGGSIRFDADGTGSLIDISLLVNLNDTNNDSSSRLYATNGGVIQSNSLETINGVGPISGVNLLVDGVGSSIDTSMLQTFNNGILELANGGTTSVASLTNIDGSTVKVSGGSTFTLPSVITAYVTDLGSNNSRTFEANGASSSLDLSSLTDVTGGGFIRVLNINAQDGASIDLSNLVNYNGGSIRFDADGAGSVIDISSLVDLDDTNNDSSSRLYATNGGTIVSTSLKTVNGVGPSSGVNLLVDGAGSSIDTSMLQTFNNGILELTNGGTISVAGLTNIDGSTIKVSGGSSFTLPAAITAYVTDLGSNNSRTFEADGAGSSLDLSSLADVTGGGFIRVLNVNAENGASVDLSNLVNYNGGSIRFDADGAGSVIDISSLMNLDDTNADSSSRLYATNGGAILSTGLEFINGTGPNSGVHLLVDGATSSIDTSMLQEFKNGIFELTNGGSADVANLTTINGSSLKVSGGSTLTLPTAVTAYITDSGSNQSRTFEADGAASLLDLSSLITVTGGDFIQKLDIEANDGAEVDLSGVITIPDGVVQILADGAGSQVQLTSLSQFSNSNTNNSSDLAAESGGTINLATSGTTQLTNIDIFVDATSAITGDTLELLGTSLAEQSVLSGQGMINANVINSALITPGSSAGTLSIDGDLTLMGDSILFFEIGGLTAGTDYDVLNVTGNASFGGIIEFDFLSGFEAMVSAGDTFTLLSANSILDSFASVANGERLFHNNGQDSFLVHYGSGSLFNANELVFSDFESIPEPETYLLFGLGLGCVFIYWRRREG